MRSWLLTALLFAHFIEPPAGHASPALRVFSDSKQPVSAVAIAEDADGLLWIAADQGVFCFDGRNFLKIPGEFDTPAGIAVVGGKTVLVGANNGVFQYLNGVTTRLSAESTNAFTKLSDDLVLVLHGKDGRNWMDAASWDGKRTAIHIQHEQTDWGWLSLDGLLWQKCGTSACSVRNDESLRDAARRGELKQHQISKGQVTATRLPAKPGSFVRAANGSYIVRTDFSGTIAILNPGSGSREFYVGEFTRGNGRPFIYPDHSGRFWIPGDYLWVSDGKTVKKASLPQIDAVQVNCVFEDSRHRIWFGLAQKGLAVMDSQPVAESWYTPADSGDISSLIREDPETLYATTSKGMVLRKNGSGDWLPLALGDGPQISQLAPGPDHTLLGLIRIGPAASVSPDGQILQRLPADPDVMLSSFRRIVRTPGGEFLIGGLDGLYRVSRDRLETLTPPALHGNAQDITFDKSGAALVANMYDVCRVEGRSCKPFLTEADGLLDPRIRSVGAGPPGEVWVAYRTPPAFSRFRYSDGRWTARHFTAQTGFEETETQFLRRDRRGWVWRGTQEGLWVSDGEHVEPGDWIRISEQDGLPSSVIHRYGFLEDEDGTIWIGTARGIAHIQPDAAWFATPDNVRISGIGYDAQNYLETAQRPGIFQSPGVFTASFGGKGLLPVQFRLLPRDRQWRVSRTGQFGSTRLEAGRYELQATVGRGGPVTRYAFEVKPSAGERARFAMLIASPPAILAVLVAVTAWRKKRAAMLPPLPDLTEARLAVLSPATHGLVGTALDGRFTPRKTIARGGFGTVFDGHDAEAGRRCAIKVFRSEFADQGLANRFQQEVLALKTISHPNVVRIYGHGTTPGGSPYLVMEFVEGQTLRDLLKDGSLPPKTCGGLIQQMGNALHEIHSNCIYHRDVKPENLMIRTHAAAEERVVLIDFSMAIVKDPDKTLHGLSRAGGTVHYMAPEQALGHGSTEADIYSLAKVVIEMITGRMLVELLPDAGLDLSLRVRELLLSRSFGLSPVTVDLLATALEFDPGRRPGNVRNFTQAIAEDLAGR